jgi:outer membrane protein assembly factor BamB
VNAAYHEIDAAVLSLPAVQLSAQQITRVEAVITSQNALPLREDPPATPQEHLMSPAPVPTRLVRFERRVSALASLAAVLVLVAGAFALFSFRHAPSTASLTEHGTLYTVSYTGTVYAVDPVSGAIIWSTPLGIVPDEQFLIAGGSIFLASSCIHSTCELYAVQASGGHLLWHRSYRDLLGTTGATSLTRYLASDGQALYIGSATGIYAWRASDGQPLWQRTPPPACLAKPDACLIDMETAGNGLVYVYFDGLYALNATDGSTRWSDLQVPDMGDSSTPLVVAHNHVYVPDYGGSVTMHVLQAATGKLLDTAGLPQVTAAEIITDGDVVYLSNSPASGGSADIYALRSGDNQLLWHHHEATVMSLDTVSTGSLYFSDMAALSSAQAHYGPVKQSEAEAALSTLTAPTFRVCAVRTTDGSLQSCHSLPEGFFPPAAASQGIIYAVGASQGLDAIRLSDGKVLWHVLEHVALDDGGTVLT